MPRYPRPAANFTSPGRRPRPAPSFSLAARPNDCRWNLSTDRTTDPAIAAAHDEVIAHLSARHDELIRKLDELNADIERVLTEFAKSRNAGTQDTRSAEPTTDAAIRRAA